MNSINEGEGDVRHGDYAEKTLPAPGFKPAIIRPLCCSHTFKTGLGILLILLGRALSSTQYSGGPSSGCYGHFFGC